MTFTLSCLALFAVVVSCLGQTTPVPSVQADVQPARVCSLPGQICSTCDSVSICIGNGDGSITTVNQECRIDENCVEGQCIKGALCNYRPFQCSEEGFFPDPYDCTKYHVCVPGATAGSQELMSFQCSNGSSYDALSASCGYSINTTACVDRPVPDCTQRLQVGAIPSDGNLYYICVEKEGTLAPELHRCPGGLPFKADKLTCKSEETKPAKDKKKSKKTKSKAD